LVEQLTRNEQVAGSSPVRGSKMKYYLYFLYSGSLDKYYIGHTNNLERRIYEHNLGKEKFTRKSIPWEINFFRIFDINTETLREECRLKKCKSRKYLENYMTAQLVEHPDM
jgi:putative endonuclease